MVSDRDAIGLIASSCVIFVFLVGFGIVIGCFCYRRLERKKTHDAMRRALSPRKYKRNKFKHLRDSRSISSSDNPTDTTGRLADYRPKILTSEDQQMLTIEERKSQNEVELRQQNAAASFEQTQVTQKRIETSVLNGRAVSVINVNENSSHYGGGQYGRREFPSQSQVYQGYVRAPDLRPQQLAVPEWQRVSGGRYSQQSGEVIIGGNLSQVNGESVRGQIIKQNVEMGRDGRLEVTSTQQSNVINAASSQQPTFQTAYGVIPSAGGAVYHTKQVIKQKVEMGDDGRLVVTDSQRGDTNGVGGFETTEHSSHSVHISEARHTARDEEAVGSYHISPSGLLTPSEHEIEGWRSATEDALENLESTPAVPDIVVDDAQDNNVPQSSSSSEGSSSSTSREEESPREIPRSEPISSEFYSDTTNLKVIKKHSVHKPPDWLVEAYADSATDASSPEHRDSAVQVEDDDGPEIVRTASFSSRGSARVHFGNTSTIDNNMGQQRQQVEVFGSGRTNSLIQQAEGYSETGLGYYTTVTGFIKPPETTIRSFENVETSDDGTTTTTRVTTTSMTASAMRHARQEIHETGEVPHAFTSTPRAPWQLQGADTSYIASGSGLATEVKHHRQRDSDFGRPPTPPLIVEVD